jgi:hypothetical protein
MIMTKTGKVRALALPENPIIAAEEEVVPETAACSPSEKGEDEEN